MTEQKKLSERIKRKAFRLHPADRDSVVVSKATLDRWINEIAAQEQRLAEAGWQPIETAPVGQRLLFWWSPIGDDKCAQDCVTGSLVYDLDSGERTGEWWNDQTGKYQDVIYLTHWMPLPSPPQENTHD